MNYSQDRPERPVWSESVYMFISFHTAEPIARYWIGLSNTEVETVFLKRQKTNTEAETVFSKRQKCYDESGVRTHARRTVPKTVALDHSAISPLAIFGKHRQYYTFQFSVIDLNNNLSLAHRHRPSQHMCVVVIVSSCHGGMLIPSLEPFDTL